jgi:hypothetical protein
MWTDTEPMKACPRYFGSELERVIEAPIALSWPDPFRMTVKIDDGKRAGLERCSSHGFVSSGS